MEYIMFMALIQKYVSAKEMLKRLKNELLQEKQSLDIILNT